MDRGVLSEGSDGDRLVPRNVPIRGDMIRLGQMLKLGGVAEGGGHVKALIAEGAVRVNGVVDTRRGRQLEDGDVVVAEGEALRVVGEGAGERRR